MGNNATACERNCGGLEVIRYTILHIEADADRDPGERLTLPARFTQHASELSVLNHQIVGPLQLKRLGKQGLQRLGDGETGPEADHLQALRDAR